MANGHGGYRPGGGRPKGTHAGAQLKSRLSPEQQARASEAVRLANADGPTFTGDAYALLSWIYRSEDLPLSFRMRAAETAIAYERPKLAQVEVKGDEDNPLRLVHDIMQLLQGTGRGLPSGDPTEACESALATEEENLRPTDTGNLRLRFREIDGSRSGSRQT